MAPSRKPSAAEKGKAPKDLALLPPKRGHGHPCKQATAPAATPRESGRGLPSLVAVAGERRGASSRDEGGRGRGGRDGARQRMVAARTPHPQLHSFDVSSEFMVWAEKPGGLWLRLPRSFGDMLPAGGPGGVWLQADGCCSGASWVEVDVAPSGDVFLERG